jgi:hypothetical protein
MRRLMITTANSGGQNPYQETSLTLLVKEFPALSITQIFIIVFTRHYPKLAKSILHLYSQSFLDSF